MRGSESKDEISFNLSQLSSPQLIPLFMAHDYNLCCHSSDQGQLKLALGISDSEKVGRDAERDYESTIVELATGHFNE